MSNIITADLTAIHPVIRRSMINGRIRSVVPLSVIEQDNIKGVYCIDDLICLSDCRFNAVSILELTERIIHMLEELRDYLIFPEEILLRSEYIFIDREVRQTRICVVPKSVSDVGEKENVSYLLNQLKEFTDEKGKAYMDVFLREYMKGNKGTDRLIGFAEEMKKEAGSL